MNFTVKRYVDELGRIVLTKDFRNFYGISTNSAVELVATENGIFIKNCSPKQEPKK